MPIRLERRLKRRARALHLGKQRTNAYIYGTLRRMGWRPTRQKQHGHRRNRNRNRKQGH